ncbi:hypothetical protein SIN8267_02765 [Sinobacterium norvegicum]|uniref:Invasion protein n=1 Tax=Sinobacterium norvegicum TaxID=1641715 RepID=A0ABM9AIN2_9GAMM|nr:SirB2 family protein [Sinobacterium norvegicum]CAH0992632.1 hypothetical protein SIN8267_02765 [Sinobacterium norvegicum]
MYAIAKHLHMTLAIVSILFFIGRGMLVAIKGQEALNRKWLKITPHIVDTFLLLAAVVLMTTLSIYPFGEVSWLTAKVLALICYIALGVIALKAGRPNSVRVIAFLLAVVAFGYMLAVAITKSPSLGL